MHFITELDSIVTNINRVLSIVSFDAEICRQMNWSNDQEFENTIFLLCRVEFCWQLENTNSFHFYKVDYDDICKEWRREAAPNGHKLFAEGKKVRVLMVYCDGTTDTLAGNRHYDLLWYSLAELSKDTTQWTCHWHFLCALPPRVIRRDIWGILMLVFVIL